MLKNISFFILLLTLRFVSPVSAQDDYIPISNGDGYIIDSLEIDTSDDVEEEYEELEEQTQRIVRKDSVNGKALDSTTWKNLTKDLNYGDTLEHQKKPDEKVEKKEDSKPWNFPGFGINSAFTKYVLFAIVIAALLYLLYRLISSAIFVSDPKIKKVKATFEILHDDEQMMQKDLGNILEAALQQKDYKTAIRILFIQSLQDLQTYEWIKWKKEKTNRDYLNELNQRDVFVPFGSMVLLYEKAWYSQFVTTEEDFHAFNTFKQQINRV
ncbi:MAG: hypothetical protein JWM14_2607 [Chitinophagaceae bacterium]|nr:hypothetical protein [Chitinophagaceae bacterium]